MEGLVGFRFGYIWDFMFLLKLGYVLEFFYVRVVREKLFFEQYFLGFFKVVCLGLGQFGLGLLVVFFGDIILIFVLKWDFYVKVYFFQKQKNIFQDRMLRIGDICWFLGKKKNK